VVATGAWLSGTASRAAAAPALLAVSPSPATPFDPVVLLITPLLPGFVVMRFSSAFLQPFAVNASALTIANSSTFLGLMFMKCFSRASAVGAVIGSHFEARNWFRGSSTDARIHPRTNFLSYPSTFDAISLKAERNAACAACSSIGRIRVVPTRTEAAAIRSFRETIMSRMMAYRIHEFGGPEKISLETVDVTDPTENEVLVRVQTASVNPVDLKTLAGKYPLIGEDKLPYTLGRDFAGVVERVGGGVTRWKPADPVYGFVGQGQGAYAQCVLVDEHALARPPKDADPFTAGAVPLAALTAWQGLFEHGALESGERVLIHGGAGGVGHFAVQFARYKGAEVFVTASGDGLDFVRELGADHVIDYSSQRFEDIAQDVDLVFDLVGGEAQTRSWAVVAAGGALISTLTEPSQVEASRRGAHAARYTAQPNGAQLAAIASLIQERKVVVKVVETYPFDATPQALARQKEGHVRGKLVVDVGGANAVRTAV
jgi:NADPH:quinone reductase-like Zn-dependent oxidoreductase